jgi:Protein of unknown function (DUF2911)
MTNTSLRRMMAIAALGSPCLSAHAQQSAFYVTTLGRDTLAFEQFERTADSIVGDWVTTYGGVMVHHYTIHLQPGGGVDRYQLVMHRLSGHVDGTFDLQFAGDSLIARSADGREQRVAMSGALPVAAYTIGALDLVAARARASGNDSSVAAIVSAFGPYRRGAMPMVFFGDSARLGNPRAPLWVTLDRDGHIAALSARATTTRSETRRVPSYDWHALIAHFPNIPDSVDIVGVPAISPRDSVKTVLGDATITIDYGRPAVRGRAVFAHGILGDTLWRTGANAATRFVTTRDLVIGTDTLRAGAYSLWTRVSPDDSTYALVFNSQTGQWGTEHHPERDVLSVPLHREVLRPALERFMIRLPSDARTSQLRLEWAGTALTVAVRAR